MFLRTFFVLPGAKLVGRVGMVSTCGIDLTSPIRKFDEVGQFFDRRAAPWARRGSGYDLY